MLDLSRQLGREFANFESYLLDSGEGEQSQNQMVGQGLQELEPALIHFVSHELDYFDIVQRQIEPVGVSSRFQVQGEIQVYLQGLGICTLCFGDPDPGLALNSSEADVVGRFHPEASLLRTI